MIMKSVAQIDVFRLLSVEMSIELRRVELLLKHHLTATGCHLPYWITQCYPWGVWKCKYGKSKYKCAKTESASTEKWSIRLHCSQLIECYLISTVAYVLCVLWRFLHGVVITSLCGWTGGLPVWPFHHQQQPRGVCSPTSMYRPISLSVCLSVCLSFHFVLSASMLKYVQAL